MNVKTVCEKAGITRRHWNYLMSGVRNASPETAKTLARVLGVDRALFVFGTAKMRQSAWKKAQRQALKMKG